VGVEEEGQAGRKRVHVLTRFHAGLDVADAVRQGERQLLRRRRAGLADVIPADGDSVPERHLLGAESNHVDDDPQGRPGWIDPLLLCDVLLQDIVLDGAAHLRPGHTLLPRHCQIHRQQNGRGSIDGHGGRNAAQGDFMKERLHVGKRIDGYALAADLALRSRIVRIESHERRHVEGH
jgi:hypothetical protein